MHLKWGQKRLLNSNLLQNGPEKQWADRKKFVLQKDGRARRWMGKTEFKGPSGRGWTSKITNKKFNDWELQQKSTKIENWRVKSPI